MNAGSSKMDSNLTGMWVSFFTAAGIPSEVAATYALTFAENRIQTDMLLDLNKEYLKDMDITRMGDVIAILRHAKQVHESTARDRVLSIGATAKVPVAAVTGRATVTQPSSPASRILGHYTRNTVQETPPAATQQKRKFVDTGANTEANIKKTRLIRFGTTSEAVVNEDTTNKHTVFSRLGGNTESLKSVVTVTKSNPKTVSLAKSVPIKPEAKTIFARLGAKAKAVADEQVIPIPKDALKYEGILKSDPVFQKMVTVTTTRNHVRRIMGCTMKTEERPAMKVVKEKVATGCTMRADESPVSIKSKLSMPKSVKFSNRVEYKEIETRKVPVVVKQKLTTVFNKPERRLSMPVMTTAPDNTVKARLGMKNVNNMTITKNVFNRLGA